MVQSSLVSPKSPLRRSRIRFCPFKFLLVQHIFCPSVVFFLIPAQTCSSFTRSHPPRLSCHRLIAALVQTKASPYAFFATLLATSYAPFVPFICLPIVSTGFVPPSCSPFSAPVSPLCPASSATARREIVTSSSHLPVSFLRECVHSTLIPHRYNNSGSTFALFSPSFNLLISHVAPHIFIPLISAFGTSRQQKEETG